MAFCWNCKSSEYHDYNEDPKGVLRCPRCGELEQDDPAKSKAQPVKAVARNTSRSK